MRNIEIARECLRYALDRDATAEETVERAEKYYAFVTGEGADDAKAKLAIVREAVTS